MGRVETQYRAFISYSHADKAAADWLHRALEGYRVPARLVGTDTALGPVPARLAPIFRDRDELPAAGDLSAELTAALRKSMFLIVIASPAAARSRWVNEEVRQFKLLHGRKRGDGTARVLALIVDGDPGDAGAGTCFPPALRFHVLPDGGISDDPAEPIAADIRPGGDGKRLALLKLAAGLTGLPLDALVQREAQRRQRRAALLSGVSLALAAVMAVLTVLAVQGRREAERQRAQADGLIEYMLTDLRQKLEPVGRLEVMDSVGHRALAYYAAQDLSALDADALGRRARALHLVGEVRDLRGDGEGALNAFREAERTTAELLARDPDNPDRMFDHAQSVFWVGQVAWARKDWPTTEARFRTYVELADRMAATDPANPKWQMEQGYAANNLGALLLVRGQAAAAVPHFRRAVAVAAAQARADPGDSQRQIQLGQAHAWLADALLDMGAYAEARANRQAELEVYSRLLAADPKDFQAAMMIGRSHDAAAELYLLEGSPAAAVERGRIAHQGLQALVAQAPDNTELGELATNAANLYAESLLLAGRVDAASDVNAAALAAATALVRSDPSRTNWRTGPLMRARLHAIAIAFARGARAEGRDGLARFEAEFGPLRADDLAAGAGQPWVQAAALAAAERLGAGDGAGARVHAAEARAAARAGGSPRTAALLRELDRRIPGQAPAPAGVPSAYPADRLLGPVAGAGPRPG